MQVVQVADDSSKRGWGRYTISLPQSVRMQYLDDVVYGPEWRSLLADFDKKLPSFLIDSR